MYEGEGVVYGDDSGTGSAQSESALVLWVGVELCVYEGEGVVYGDDSGGGSTVV